MSTKNSLTNKILFSTTWPVIREDSVVTPVTASGPILAPIIMVQWKMGPSNMSFLSSKGVIHFHDYGRK